MQAPAHPSDDQRSWSPLILLAVAQFMVVLDITIVNVALPSIGADLDFAGEDLQWVVTIYVLLTGGLLLLGGRLADVVPRRAVFLSGLAVFTLASLLSGLAQSPGVLIAARAGQGVGAALLTPAALSLMTSFYSGKQLTAALSAWSAIGSAGAAIGVVLGGVLTTALSWEWIFLVNVPIGVVALVLAPRVLPAGSSGTRARTLDLPGALLVVAGLVVLVYAIDGVAEHGWGSVRTLGLIAVALALLTAFIRVEAGSRNPLVPPATWRIRPLISGSAMILLATGILVGTFFLNSLYLQGVNGSSALETGLGFLPFAVAIGIAANVAAKLLPHAGARVLISAGMVLTGIGALVLVLAPDRASYLPDILPGLLVMGVGIGLVFPAASVAAMGSVEPHQIGLASGVLSTSHELGAALGVSVLAAIAAIGEATGTDPATLATGYENGFIAAAVIAIAAGAIAAFAVPRMEPAQSVQATAH